MKIAVLSKADAYGGGASKVAVDLTAALTEAGMQVSHHVAWAGTERLRDQYPAHVMPIYGPFVSRLIVKCALFGQWRLGIPEALPVELAWIAMSKALDADIIHVHDITELMSPLTLLWLSRKRPVVWTLHDMSAFTAGCIASFDQEPLGCRRWQAEGRGCGSDCPIRQKSGYPFGGLFNGVPLLWREKSLLARFGRHHAISPSSWLADEMCRSKLYEGRRPEVIFNGIDTQNIFTPRDKVVSKLALGLKPERPVIVVMAGNLADENKGFRWSVQALQALPEAIRQSVQVLCIGHRDEVGADQLAGLDVTWAGYVQDQRLLAIMLSASDLLLYPSMADNQPLAVLEALACGTPVFAFRTGGIPEMLTPACGFLAERKDYPALASGMAGCLVDGKLAAMGQAARLRATAAFSRSRMAADYLAMYRRVLGRPALQTHPTAS